MPRWYLKGATMRQLDELIIQLLMAMGIAVSMVVLIASALF